MRKKDFSRVLRINLGRAGKLPMCTDIFRSSEKNANARKFSLDATRPAPVNPRFFRGRRGGGGIAVPCVCGQKRDNLSFLSTLLLLFFFFFQTFRESLHRLSLPSSCRSRGHARVTRRFPPFPPFLSPQPLTWIVKVSVLEDARDTVPTARPRYPSVRTSVFVYRTRKIRAKSPHGNNPLADCLATASRIYYDDDDGDNDGTATPLSCWSSSFRRRRRGSLAFRSVRAE